MPRDGKDLGSPSWGVRVGLELNPLVEKIGNKKVNSL